MCIKGGNCPPFSRVYAHELQHASPRACMLCMASGLPSASRKGDTCTLPPLPLPLIHTAANTHAADTHAPACCGWRPAAPAPPGRGPAAGRAAGGPRWREGRRAGRRAASRRARPPGTWGRGSRVCDGCDGTDSGQSWVRPQGDRRAAARRARQPGTCEEQGFVGSRVRCMCERRAKTQRRCGAASHRARHQATWVCGRRGRRG